MAITVSVLVHGSKTWGNDKKDEHWIQATEMKFLKSIKGCTLRDQIRNKQIREELKIFSINDRIKENREVWKEHLNRMKDSRIPKIAYRYKPARKISLGRPRKRCS